MAGRKPIRVVWLSLDDAGSLVANVKPYQNHAVGLLRTVLHSAGIQTDLATLRFAFTKHQVKRQLKGYDVLLMSVMSFNFPFAEACAKIFKEINPTGKVIVGGYHASVALDEMEEVMEFDHICVGPGEKIVVQLIQGESEFPRVITDPTATSMADWPAIDRSLAPKPVLYKSTWPLERYSVEEPPSVSILTSRKCWGRCSYCNENTIIPNMRRRTVDQVIDELNQVDEQYGPFKSVIIHDSNFFQHPQWLREWIEKYPRRARTVWPYWASARTDSVRLWPELFRKLVTETNWRTVSLGLESGSNPVLEILNKLCTEEDNNFAINLINELDGVRIFANIMLAIPGETPDDAAKTVAMANSIKQGMVSVSYFTPYKGTVLGDKIIAEGRNLVRKGDFFRFAGKEQVAGIDYAFYDRILSTIKNYRKTSWLREQVGRSVFNGLSRNILRP